VDLVTETDQAVEEMVKKAIAEKYPDHKYMGCMVLLIQVYWRRDLFGWTREYSR
jgi:hypothetical protein